MARKYPPDRKPYSPVDEKITRSERIVQDPQGQKNRQSLNLRILSDSTNNSGFRFQIPNDAKFGES
jgi:hypothetical protein